MEISKKTGLPIIRKAEFITSAGRESEYPDSFLPEIAFAGRSNVGKSTLINKLVNRKKLVKTSNTPGRTQRINFFEINDLIRFVDLPGYGYAKVSKSMRSSWGEMIETYLATRHNLSALIWIMDIRREPGDFEHDFGSWLGYNQIPAIKVLTKADKFSKTKQLNQRRMIASKMNEPEGNFLIASGIKGDGIKKLWGKILEVSLGND